MHFCVMLLEGLAAALIGAGPAPGQADLRLPIPSRAAIAKAESEIHEVFHEDFASPRPDDRIALAAKLLRQADDLKGDPAGKYAMLLEARDLAARSGDLKTVMTAADRMSAAYQIGPGEARAAAADAIVGSATSPAVAAEDADALLDAADVATASGEFEAAATLARAAETSARRAQRLVLVNDAQKKLKAIGTMKLEADRTKQYFATLKKNPTDPAANLAVGRFLCFVRNDWAEGLPHLALGTDPKLKQAATKELNGSPEDLCAAGDEWYERATHSEPLFRPALESHACDCYSSAASGLSGLKKMKAEQRVVDLRKAIEGRDNHARLWQGIRRAIAAGQTRSWELVGGTFSKELFQELPPDGAILIGFNYSTRSNGRFPGMVQAIYLTPAGVALGHQFGSPDDGEVAETTQAKPGYAVGALLVRGGGGFDAFQPTYMRITDHGLDPADKYDGPMIGGAGGREGTLGGDGNFIVGIHGKVHETGRMDTLSPITLGK